MGIDLSRFKVVHGEKILNAVALTGIEYSDHTHTNDTVKKPKFLEVLAINEDGNLIALYDEAWTFQFLPIIGKRDLVHG